jgi:cytochrome c-type biogenesis protein CcsB
MIYTKFENFLSNLAFICLFTSMLSFWIYSSFFFLKKKNINKPNLLKTNSDTFFSEDNSTVSFTKTPHIAQFVSQINDKINEQTPVEINFRTSYFYFLGNLGMLISNITLFLLLLLRWKESGHFPLSNLYESLIFLAWGFTLIHLNLLVQPSQNFFSKFQTPGGFWTTLPNFVEWRNSCAIGCITTPCALFSNAFASFSLPEEMQKISPLVPALQSNWLMMHVTVMIISYACLIIGSLLSIAFLVLTEIKKKKEKHNSDQTTFTETLDNLSYRILGLGFPFLTIGILSGAVWANEAWGSYWSWDPKETWALLTWLIFAIYLHTRISKGWEGTKPAIIASFGFFVVWICYLGVNLIGEGLHSYGWFIKNL